MIFERALEGLYQNKFALLLMEKGIRISTGNANWHDSTVRFILIKKYIGEENYPIIIL